jgi:hypothetical protein
VEEIVRTLFRACVQLLVLPLRLVGAFFRATRLFRFRRRTRWPLARRWRIRGV